MRATPAGKASVAVPTGVATTREALQGDAVKGGPVVRYNVPELFLKPELVKLWTFAVMALAYVGIGLAEQPRWLTDDTLYFHLAENPSPAILLNAVKRAYQFLYQKMRADQLERQLSDRTRELREVTAVGIALSAERDHSVLLRRTATAADGADDLPIRHER